MAVTTCYFCSTGRHIDRNIHHHYGFTAAGGWFVWSGGTGVYDALGASEPEFIGGKYWDRANDQYAELTRVAVHITAGFFPPPEDYLEICSIHALPPPSIPGAPEAFRHMSNTVTQCWIGLGTDGKFRLMRGWNSGQPATPDAVLATCPTAVAFISGAAPDDNELWNNETAGTEERRYIFDFTVHDSAGGVIVWRENDDGDMVKFWEVTGVNTQADTDWGTLAWSIGQRGNYNSLSHAYLTGPFTGDAGFYFRFRDVLIANEPVGKIRVHTLFASGNGSQNQFALVDPEGGLGGSPTRWGAVRDDTLRDFAPAPDEANTMVAQDGSANGEEEFFTFETLPALDSGEEVAFVGLSTYSAGQGEGMGGLISGPYQQNQDEYGFRANYFPTINTGAVTLQGPARNLFDNAEPIFTDNYVPNPDPSSQGQEGMGFLGWNAWADFWRYRSGSLLFTDTEVNALEGGVETSFRAVFLSQVTLLVVTTVPLAEAPDPCVSTAVSHQFYSPPQTDIDGQPTDDFPALGVWAKHPDSAATIASAGSEGWIVGAGRALYLVTDIEGQIATVPTPLAPDYTVAVPVTFPTVEGDGELAAIEPLARYDEAVDSGFGLRLEFDHTGGPIVGTLTLYERDAGVETRLLPASTVTLAHDTTYQPRLRVEGTVLVAELDGLVLGTFDYATDDADETSAPVTAHDTGDPGIAGFDTSGTGAFLRIDSVTVCGPDTLLPPCESPPGGCNPYPGPPPVPPEPTGIWVRRNLSWRFVAMPTAGFPDEFGVAGQANLLARAVSQLTLTPPDSFGIRRNLKWRYPIGSDGEKPPPIDCPLPPYYDPCETTPPFPPPPEVELGPPPARLLFAYELPIPNIGDLFTAAVNASGPWTRSDVTTAAANGGYIVANQGGYAKFQGINPATGRMEYLPALHKAWILSVSSHVLFAQATGRLYGIQLFDDWEVPRLWPPSGVSVATLQDVCAYARVVLPGVRLGLRARAQQFSPGNFPGNVDFIISQFRYWGLNNQTPSSYQALEKTLAATFGWDILWSINLQHGGAVIGGARQPMSLSQAAGALTVFCNDGANNHGVGCWKYDNPSGGGGNWFAQAGALDVWAQAYNDLAALGVP